MSSKDGLSKKPEDQPWHGPEILVPLNEKLLGEIKVEMPKIPPRMAVAILTKMGLSVFTQKHGAITPQQRQQLVDMAIDLDRRMMRTWRGLKSPAAKLKHGETIARGIVGLLEADKDVREGRFFTPRESREALYRNLLELQQAFGAHFQRELKKNIAKLTSEEQ